MQDLTMMPPSRLGCPLSLKTANMGNPGFSSYAYSLNLNTKVLILSSWMDHQAVDRSRGHRLDEGLVPLPLEVA